LIKYIEDPSTDMHRDVGCDLFMKSSTELTKEERSVAKNGFTFPAFYGSYFEQMAPDLWQKMPDTTKEWLKSRGCKTLNVFKEHVRDIERNFWDVRFQVYAEWKERTWRDYQKTGYIDLYTGFRCYGPMKRNEVINYRVQGSAFHCLLWTFKEVAKEIRERGWKSRLTGQIHDALVANVFSEEEAEFDKLIVEIATKRVREHWDWIIVPLTIEKERSAVDGNWSEMEGCVL